MNTNTTTIDYRHYHEQGISYEQYKENFAAELATGEASPYIQYLPQNWSRQSRLDRKLKLSAELSATIAGLEQKQHWLLITEHWCGDASQINPIVAKIAEVSSDAIDLRLVYRDEHEALIDAHLTDGRSRSIPILLVLDENYQLLASYGPRPAAAQELVQSLLAQGESYTVPLHTWYARDRQQTTQADLHQLLRKVDQEATAENIHS